MEPISYITVGEHTYTHDLWKANTSGVISVIAADLLSLVGNLPVPILPTSTKGLLPGSLWNDNGTLKVTTESDPGVADFAYLCVSKEEISEPGITYDSGDIPCAPNADKVVRAFAPFPARALRSEPGVAPFLEFPD